MSRRTLSEEERELWNSVAKQAKPLRKRAKKTEKIEKIEKVEPVAVLAPIASPLAKASSFKPITTKPRQPPPLSHFDRRERAKIAKGRREIDARIDLHGMTQARAHRALLTFLRREADNGARLALVITGKGKATSPDTPRGVLRRLVPEWLALQEFRAFVVSFEQAAIGHGGEGALYVRIRRGR